jgi:hypothetical protein
MSKKVKKQIAPKASFTDAQVIRLLVKENPKLRPLSQRSQCAEVHLSQRCISDSQPVQMRQLARRA